MRFRSEKEHRLVTNKLTTDIICDILEGRTLEIFKPIPINVSVNAVYSKYAISPHKNINFGPISFFDTKTRTFEIKNDGLFEFNFKIFDPVEGLQKEEEVVDDKKGGKGKDKKAPPKPAKGKKGEEVIAGLKIN